VSLYSRHLPHWQPTDADFFVTWRLRGSKPKNGFSDAIGSGQRFVAEDRLLDRAATGPLWMKDSRVAECVSGVIIAGHAEWQ